MQKLYHCTLARNLESIRKAGLLPRKGLLAAKFHPDAEGLIYAVDKDRKGRLIAIITRQMAINDLVQRSQNYQFEDFKNDLITHGAVVVFQTTGFRCCQNCEEPGHPPSVEVGDWYSRESVSNKSIERVMTDQEMLDFLKPHEMDFTNRYRGMLQTF